MNWKTQITKVKYTVEYITGSDKQNKSNQVHKKQQQSNHGQEVGQEKLRQTEKLIRSCRNGSIIYKRRLCRKRISFGYFRKEKCSLGVPNSYILNTLSLLFEVWDLPNGLLVVMLCDSSAGSPIPTSFSADTLKTYWLPSMRRSTCRKSNFNYNAIIVPSASEWKIMFFVMSVDRGRGSPHPMLYWGISFDALGTPPPPPQTGSDFSDFRSWLQLPWTFSDLRDTFLNLFWVEALMPTSSTPPS